MIFWAFPALGKAPFTVMALGENRFGGVTVIKFRLKDDTENRIINRTKFFGEKSAESREDNIMYKVGVVWQWLI